MNDRSGSTAIIFLFINLFATLLSKVYHTFTLWHSANALAAISINIYQFFVLQLQGKRVTMKVTWKIVDISDCYNFVKIKVSRFKVFSFFFQRYFLHDAASGKSERILLFLDIAKIWTSLKTLKNYLTIRSIQLDLETCFPVSNFFRRNVRTLGTFLIFRII